MGTSTNKSTRKFSKRHLQKALTRRKKTQRASKQRAEKEAKLQRAVRRVSDTTRELEDQKAAENQIRIEKENFVSKQAFSDITDSDLEELDSEEGLSDTSLGDEAVDPLKAEDLKFPANRPPSSSSEEETEGQDVEEEIAEYKEQFSQLQQQDPEFYKYLQEADEDLLQFQVSSENEEDTTEPQNIGTEEAVRKLTTEQVQSWCQDVLSEKPSLDSLKCLTTAYAFACQYGENTENEAEDIRALLQFSSSSVYSTVLMFVLKEGVGIFLRFLKLHKKQNVTRSDAAKATKEHPEVALQLNRFFASTCRLLSQALEGNVRAFVLRNIRSSVVLMEGAPAKISRLFLRSALEIFAAGSPAPRLQSVLLIREMVLKLGENIINLCFKGVYRSFLASAARVNRETLPQIYFMGTCIIEIYSLSMVHAYQNAFKFIKDLAVDLREAVLGKDRETAKKVVSWRYVNGLELWARLVGSLATNGDMHQLIYPIAQLLTGSARFQEHMKYLPLRLRLIAATNRLAEATGVFIPVSPLLLGILSWSFLSKKPVLTGNEKCPNLALCLDVADKTLKNSVFQSEIVEQVFELLARHLGQLSHSIAFPETSHWITAQLKKFAKSVQYPSYKSGAMQLVSATKESADKVLSRRMLVTFSPRDLAKVEQFEAEGKANRQSPLEVLSTRLEEKRKQRTSLHSNDVIQLQEPQLTQPVSKAEEKPKAKLKKQKDISLSDAESLTSDEGELKEAELKGLPMVADVLEDYIPSDDDTQEPATPVSKRQKLEKEKPLPKQKRRKEKRKTRRQKRS